MTSIDERLRQTLTVAHDDPVERDGLARARRGLDTAISSDRGISRRRNWGQRLRTGLALAPALAGTALALVIAVSAVLLIHHRSSGPTASSAPAGAHALVGRLAILRRPQTSADKLPTSVVDDWNQLRSEHGLGHLIPQLTRALPSSSSSMELYLFVTTPTGGLFPDHDGDQADVLEDASGAITVGDLPIPAAGLGDSDIAELVGYDKPAQPKISGTLASGSLKKHRPARSGTWVSIVPDGVSRVRWTVTQTGRTTSHVIQTTVVDNVAQFPAVSIARSFKAAWYTTNGQRVGTDTRLIARLETADLRQNYQAALKRAEHSRVSTPTRLLRAFSVFSFNSPTGTRLADGAVISRPSIDQLPRGVLTSHPPTLDYRQARKVTEPSGLTMYVIPGPRTLCVFAGTGGGGCAPSVSAAIANGPGIAVGGPRGTTSYGIVPKARPTKTIGMGRAARSITPEAGVYVIGPGRT